MTIREKLIFKQNQTPTNSELQSSVYFQCTFILLNPFPHPPQTLAIIIIIKRRQKKPIINDIDANKQ